MHIYPGEAATGEAADAPGLHPQTITIVINSLSISTVYY